MKRGTIEHVKMHRLAERLSLPRYAAVGIMESLWHMAATKAPTGDITAIGAEDIAFYVRWDREPSELIEALVACRWVDRDGDRLLIHDWQEHAEDSVKKWLSRHGMKFADNSVHTTQCPDMSRHVVPAIALAVADASAKPRQAAPEETDLSACADAGKPRRRKRKPKEEAKPREPNPWWDTVCEVFGMTPITKTDRTRIGKLSRDFQAKAEHAGLGPEAIVIRRDALARKWQDPDMVTPEAVMKHWDMAGGNGQARLIQEDPDNEANPRCRRPDEDCLPMGAKKYAEIFGGAIHE